MTPEDLDAIETRIKFAINTVLTFTIADKPISEDVVPVALQDALALLDEVRGLLVRNDVLNMEIQVIQGRLYRNYSNSLSDMSEAWENSDRLLKQALKQIIDTLKGCDGKCYRGNAHRAIEIAQKALGKDGAE